MSEASSSTENTNSDETIIAALPTKPKPEAIFKIDGTLTAILNHLEVVDLLNAYNVNKKFRAIVLDVIGKKRITFHEIGGTAKVFKLFGKHMTKLQICNFDVADYPADVGYTDFDKAIDIITKYGSPGKLVELEMQFYAHVFSRHTEELLQRARPFFENVRNLAVDTSFSINSDSFYNMFSLEKLRTICLSPLVITAPVIGWLDSPKLQNLQHFRIDRYGDHVSINFPRFIELHPNLKSFYCRGNQYIESIARYFPNIENLVDLQNISREQIQCFRQFNRLKSVTIQVNGTGSDLFEMLENLPNKHVLGVLKIYCWSLDDGFPDEATIERLPTIMQQFKGLKWLELSLGFFYAEKFLLTILPQLSKVTKCGLCTNVCSVSELKAVMQVVRLLKNLRVFATNATISENLYRELVKTWKERQQKESLSYPLVISVYPSDYESIMNKCRSIYDENVVRFEKHCESLFDSTF